MNEAEYKLLVNACDDLLLASDASVERVAISWLHVRCGHPYYLAPYRGLFNGHESSDSYQKMSWLPERLRLIAGMIRQKVRSMFSDNIYWRTNVRLPVRSDVLFVSHQLSASQAKGDSDDYFGSLPKQLVSEGKKVIIALNDHSKSDPKRIVADWDSSAIPRVLLANSLGYRKESLMRARLRRESLILRNLRERALPGLGKLIAIKASRQAYSSSTLATLRIGEQIGALVKKIKPKVIVLTYEGYAWERLAFAAARNAAPSIRCIGYHHSVLFPHQDALKRQLNEEYNPDHIFTTGSITCRELSQTSSLASVPVSVLGSHRLPEEKPLAPSNGDPTCLVIPEGIISECIILFEFALKCAKKLPKLRFIFRMHPVLQFNEVTARCPHLNNLPNNVELSSATIQKDFQRCKWSLYRGSSTAVHSVLAGLRPVYVQQSDEIMIDPLYQLSSWKVISKSPQDFIEQVTADIAKEPEEFFTESEYARNYCGKYMEPLDYQGFLSTAFT